MNPGKVLPSGASCGDVQARPRPALAARSGLWI